VFYTDCFSLRSEEKNMGTKDFEKDSYFKIDVEAHLSGDEGYLKTLSGGVQA